MLYGFLNSHFTINQEEIEANDEDFVSFLDLDIPLTFNDAFLNGLILNAGKVKAVFKEMKRRRGSGNAIKIVINFQEFQKLDLQLIQKTSNGLIMPLKRLIQF